MPTQYIIEFKPQGRYVKVTAVDPITGVEAVIVGDAAKIRFFGEWLWE